MQASLKLHLYKSKTYSDGTHPIVLQYIINGVVKKKVIARCKYEDWDFKTNRVKKKADNSDRINFYINEEHSKAESNLYDLKSGDKRMGEIFKSSGKLTLKDAIDMELARMQKEFRSGYYDKIKVLERQVPDTTIQIADIDKRWMEDLISTFVSNGNQNNTVRYKIKLLKSIINRYSESGVTREVKDVKVSLDKTIKMKLTSDEVAVLEDLILPENDQITATRDIFLMQVYLRGIRIGDILQATSDQFVDGRFTYTANKTGKYESIKLIDKAQAIVDKYKGKHDRLFPFFTWSPDKKKSKFDNDRARLKHKEVCTTVVNKNLKVLAVMAGIKKPLSSHIAKHTFARMAIEKISNPMVTMELLGHATLAVHQQYLNDIRKDDALDKAADDIFN
jgi:integrase/recombinase XerD